MTERPAGFVLGELDKIIERSAQYAAPPSPPQAARPEPYREERRSRDAEYSRKKKRRGFLEDLFDFD